MQELVFNTAKRTVELYVNSNQPLSLLYQFSSVPTVKPIDGYYEVIQEENGIKYPVLRVPIANTNMVIVRYDMLIQYPGDVRKTS